VHRLDRDTSGLVIIAKTDFAHRRLAEQFAQRTVKKTYIALVHGTLKDDQGTVNYPIERDPVHRKRMRALRSGRGGRSAITHFRVLERVHSAYGGFTQLEVKIETGRTHQIRVHLAALHHPVVGDKLYGRGTEIPREKGRGEALALGRNFLHAAELEFEHPRTGARIRLHADLPEELTRLLARIRADQV
jgi:23S rRNA pseudouridine1911/1915/1917 synthase